MELRPSPTLWVQAVGLPLSFTLGMLVFATNPSLAGSSRVGQAAAVGVFGLATLASLILTATVVRRRTTIDPATGRVTWRRLFGSGELVLDASARVRITVVKTRQGLLWNIIMFTPTHTEQFTSPRLGGIEAIVDALRPLHQRNPALPFDHFTWATLRDRGFPAEYERPRQLDALGSGTPRLRQDT